jgi:hypothetical protein
MERTSFLGLWEMILKNLQLKNLKIYKNLLKILMSKVNQHAQNINTVIQKIIYKLSNHIGVKINYKLVRMI